jgi:hypothetical protein
MPKDTELQHPKIEEQTCIVEDKFSAVAGVLVGYFIDSRGDPRAVVRVDGENALRALHPSRVEILKKNAENPQAMDPINLATLFWK